MDKRPANSIVITLIITAGLIILSSSVLIVVRPDASATLIQGITTLIALATTTIVTLRSLGKTNTHIETNERKLNVIGKNVNGNLSRLIDYAEQTGYNPELLNEIKLGRDELEQHIPVNERPTHYR